MRFIGDDDERLGKKCGVLELGSERGVVEQVECRIFGSLRDSWPL